MGNEDDLVIDQIREVRHHISEEHGHNPQELVNFYIELQKQYPSLKTFNESDTELVKVS